MESGYWQNHVLANRLARRRFLAGTASVGLAAAAAGLVGCSSNNKTANSAKPAASAAAAQSSAATPGAAASRAATAGAATGSATPAANVPDPTKGKSGGSIVIQNQGYHGGLSLLKRNAAAARVIGLAYSGLLEFNFGRPPSNGIDLVPEADVAQALPEQTDDVTYVFKLKPGVKFQNGRDMTSQDIAYSFDAYAHGDKNGPSASASYWLWYDHTETPDPQTAVIKTKGPFADAVLSFATGTDGFIMAKEFEEGPDYSNKMMGSGPFVFDSDTPPVSTVVKKNANYWWKPYPYFDQVTVLGQTDVAKQVSDFISRQVHLTYTQQVITSAQIKQGRPDAVLWGYFSSAYGVIPRVDQAPFTDKRVRQALSMAIDRKAIRDSVNQGQGEDDQVMSPTIGSAWGFRKPSQLGAAAKYWTFDPQAAKQLLQAAGIDKPIDTQMVHPDASFIGQPLPDSATLVEAQWKQAGVANTTDVVQTAGQIFSTVLAGNFDGVGMGPGGGNTPTPGTNMKNLFWSPPEGVKAPTANTGHVNDSQLNPLLEKQLTQLNHNDRLQTLHQIEDILAEQQYRFLLSTYPLNYFSDPSLRDLVMPKWAFSYGSNYMQYWWFA